MKKRGFVFLAFGLFIGITYGIYQVNCYLNYNNNIGCYWDLADRASTIAQKSEYIDKFVNALNKQKLEGVNSSLFIQTPATGFDENMKALKSLQNRLHEIKGMDENSFAYQTALHQITEQEQGQASGMLDNIHSCWQRENYYVIWNWIIFTLITIIYCGLLLIALCFIVEDSCNY